MHFRADVATYVYTIDLIFYTATLPHRRLPHVRHTVARATKELAFFWAWGSQNSYAVTLWISHNNLGRNIPKEIIRFVPRSSQRSESWPAAPVPTAIVVANLGGHGIRTFRLDRLADGLDPVCLSVCLSVISGPRSDNSAATYISVGDEGLTTTVRTFSMKLT